MRKKSIFLSIVLSIQIVFFAFMFLPRSFAQESTTETPSEENTVTPTPTQTPETYGEGFEKAYKVYLEQIEVYKDAHEEYVLKRSQYLRFSTLQSQEDAQKATITMLEERDGVVISYFVTLKERLREQAKTDDSILSELNILIDDQIGWFTDHRNRVSSAGNLVDLVNDSNEASGRFEASKPLIYRVLGTISSGKVVDMGERLDDKFTELKEKIDEIRVDEREDYQLSSEKIQKLDSWIFDSELRIQRYDEKQSQADNMINNISSSKKVKNAGNEYGQSIQYLYEAKEFLRQSSSFMLEILREIRTKDS